MPLVDHQPTCTLAGYLKSTVEIYMVSGELGITGLESSQPGLQSEQTLVIVPNELKAACIINIQNIHV